MRPARSTLRPEAENSAKETYVVFQVAVAVELTEKHVVSGLGVGQGGMCVLEVATAVELIGCNEGALFHLVEYVLHVDEMASFDFKVQSAACELFHQQRHVELVAVVASYVASVEDGEEGFGHLPESGAVLHVFVSYMMYCRRFRRNRHFRIDSSAFLLLCAVGTHLYVGKFHYAVSGLCWCR